MGCSWLCGAVAISQPAKKLVWPWGAGQGPLLNALDQERVLCLIATHDLELCDMASEAYTRAHFEEKISDDDILFDYKLKPGPAVSRNAIHLLKLIGFDEGIVKAAHARADQYVATGKWE